MRGHASVFGRLSHDLGGFQNRVAAGAFTDVLDANPDVHFVWDHDTRFTLGRTLNNTLELRQDPMGLHIWSRVAPTSYAADLRVLLDRGDISQMSIAFIPGSTTWTETDNGDGTLSVVRTIDSVAELFDVTVCAQGLFPQTDIALASREAAAAGIDTTNFTPTDRAPGTERVEDHEPPADAGADSAAVDLPKIQAHARARVRVAQAKQR